MMDGVLHDAGLASFVAGVLSIVIVLIGQLDEFRWGRKWQAGRDDRNLRVSLIRDYYQRRPTRELYALVPHMALEAPEKSRLARFERRSARVVADGFSERVVAEDAGRRWLATVGTFAQAVARDRIPLRTFLATYHLGVMREGAVAVPIAARLLSQGHLSADEREQLYWGMALLDLAGDYNSVARQQRAAVFYEERQHQPPIGPVRVPPRRILRPVHDLIDVASPNFQLRRWRYLRSRRWIGKLVGRMTSGVAS